VKSEGGSKTIITSRNLSTRDQARKRRGKRVDLEEKGTVALQVNKKKEKINHKKKKERMET